jgi:hypothetical protein
MSTSCSRALCALAAALGALLATRAARADDASSGVGGASEPPPKPTRRAVFTFGLDSGIGVASIVGYPNDVTKVGFERWYTTTGARPAGVLEAWVGVPVTDYLTLSLGFKGSRLVADLGQRATSYGGMFHIEAFPLFPLGGPWRSLGVRLDVGLGTAFVADSFGNKVVDGGSTSILGGGIFYEGFRGKKTAFGPFLMGDYIWSDTARRPAIFLGWRAAFYARP